MALDAVIGEAPQLAIGLWILLAIVFLGAFSVGLYGIKDVLADEWRTYKADRDAAAAAAPTPQAAAPNPAPATAGSKHRAA